MKTLAGLVKGVIWAFIFQAAVYLIITRALPTAVAAFAPEISVYTSGLVSARVGWAIYIRAALCLAAFTALLPAKKPARAVCLVLCFLLTVLTVRINGVPLLIAASSAVSVLSSM